MVRASLKPDHFLSLSQSSKIWIATPKLNTRIIYRTRTYLLSCSKKGIGRTPIFIRAQAPFIDHGTVVRSAQKLTFYAGMCCW